MAKKSKRRRNGNGFKLPIAVAAPLALIAVDTYDKIQTTDLKTGMETLVAHFTGYYMKDNSFDIRRLRYAAMPLGFGLLVHKLAGRFGLNRAIANAGIPILRI